MFSGIWRAFRHLSVAVLAVTIAAASPRAQDHPDPTGSATFIVLMHGIRIGSETISVNRTGGGWLVDGSGRLQAPVDLTTDTYQITYGPDWQAQRLAVQTSFRGEPRTLATNFGVTTASNEVRRGTTRATANHQVSPRAVILPNDFFAGYEMLALRLAASPIGTRIPIYIPPAAETSITLTNVTPRRVSLPDRTLDLREYALTIATPGGVRPVELWVDSRGRLARLVAPTMNIVALREDLANIMAREERARNPRDDDEFIGADGFSLAATITPAAAPAPRSPAVIFVSGPGPQDRDYIAYGVSIHAQLAGAVADAGYFAVRYDARGAGLSGGRSEAARIDEYADDVVGIVKWLRKRRDIDEKRITVVGYGDGGPVAMLAASREKNIAGLALLASPGRTGREVVLERQQAAFNSASVAEAERAERVALQVRVMDAVTTGKGWDDLPEELRATADTHWFKSWLQFSPADVMKKVRQPVLVLHGALDSEVPLAHATRLDELARARKGAEPGDTTLRVVASVNHLLIPATSGSVDEYTAQSARSLAPEVPKALVEWLETARR